MPRTQNPNWPVVTHKAWLTSDPNDPAVDWATAPTVDLSPYVEEWTAEQARQHELDTFQAGSWTGVLDNLDGRFDPDNAAGPYAGLLLPMRRLETVATWAGTPYPVLTAYVRGWPQRWAKLRGQSDLTAVDPLGALAKSRSLQACYVEEVLADSPLAYYPLDEPDGATSFRSLVGGWQAAPVVNSKYGGATVVAGADGLLTVEPGTAVAFSGANGPAQRGSTVQLAAGGYGPYTTNQAGTGWGWECWFRASAPLTDPGKLVNQVAVNAGGALLGNGTLQLNVGGTLDVGPADTTHTTPASPRYDDDLAHHVVYTFEADGKHWHLYVDGAQVLSGTNATVFASNLPSPGWVMVGGLLTSGAQQLFLGTGATVRVQHVAVYAHEVTAAQALAHYQAGTTAFAGELSGARAARLLRYAAWNAPSTVDAGLSTTGPLAGLAGQRALGALTDTAQAEAGAFYAGRDGGVVFRGRAARYNQPVVATFGERADLGELPYLRDVATDADDTFLVDEVRLSRPDGTTVVRSDTASGRRYFHATFERTLNLFSNVELESAADYYAALYAAPRTRMARLTIRPSTNPALWPVALGLGIGQRVQATRRPFGAPARTYDLLVEGVRHQVGPDEWLTTLTFSPADAQTYWQLGTAGFSELGSTTRLAF